MRLGGRYYDFVTGGGKMDVDLIFQIAAIGIVVAVMTTIAGLIVVLMMIITQISILFETIKQVFNLY